MIMKVDKLIHKYCVINDQMNDNYVQQSLRRLGKNIQCYCTAHNAMLLCNDLNTRLINVDVIAKCKLGQRQIATPYGSDILQTCLSQL